MIKMVIILIVRNIAGIQRKIVVIKFNKIKDDEINKQGIFSKTVESRKECRNDNMKK